jgi:tetratricopeptide (TPR) repeat protein
MIADQPPATVAEAPTAFWQRLPPADRPGPQEQDAAALLLRAMSTPDREQRLILLRQARTRLLRPTRFRGMVVCTEAAELAALEREVEAAALAPECLQLRPGDPQALMISAATKLGRPDPSDGVRELMAAIARFPRLADAIDAEAMGLVMRKLTYVDQGALAAELMQVLAASGWGRDDPAQASRMTVLLMKRLIEKGQTSEAVQLLPRVIDPRMAILVLADRAFDPIRSDVEAWAGGDPVAQRDAFVAATDQAFSIKPDMKHRLDFAFALEAAGRRDEAIELLRPAITDPSQWGSTDNDHYHLAHAAVRLASLLRDLGRHEEAVSILERTEARMRAQANEYAPNIVPNLVRMLLRANQADRALAVLDARTPKLADVEGQGALGHFEALRLCARKQKGEAVGGAVDDFQRTHAGNRLVQRTLAGCLNDRSVSKAVVMADLDDPDLRDSYLAAAQLLRLELRNPDLEGEMEILKPTLNDPEVGATLRRLGRDLPASYRPALSAWSQSR